jgi:shikimate dehydrogenase
MSIGGGTRLLGLIGRPVAHSLSPKMHNASFRAEGLDYVYVAMDVAPEDLPAAVEGASVLGFRGFNLTMPHKRAMLPLLDDVDELAALAGAVNTVVIEDSKLRGYNTDGSGFVEACTEAGVDLTDRKVLLLGAGGAAASIALAVGRQGARKLLILNRNLEHALELAEKLRAAGGGTKVEACPADTLDETAAEAEVIVNATPLGMRRGDPLPVPAGYLDGGKAVCDAVYLPGAETALIRHARQRGARVVTGERMLLYQGVEAQRLWTGREPNVQAMSDAISS